jgi:hypothetical protein
MTKKSNWIGYIVCRNCLLKHVTKRKMYICIEVTRRQGRRCNKLVENLRKERILEI